MTKEANSEWLLYAHNWNLAWDIYADGGNKSDRTLQRLAQSSSEDMEVYAFPVASMFDAYFGPEGICSLLATPQDACKGEPQRYARDIVHAATHNHTLRFEGGSGGKFVFSFPDDQPYSRLAAGISGSLMGVWMTSMFLFWKAARDSVGYR